MAIPALRQVMRTDTLDLAAFNATPLVLSALNSV
jgi:hypothetical protein